MDVVQKQQVLTEYGANNMAKLKRISFPLFIRFGDISLKDHDDFYSKANETLWMATENFDESKGIPFEQFLKGCLARKFKTEMTGLNREKRKCDRLSVSMDTPIGDDDNSTIVDLIASDFDMSREVFGEDDISDIKVEKYLDRLSKTQRRIVELLVNYYKPMEIQKMLHITAREYSDNIKAIQSYENIKVLL